MYIYIFLDNDCLKCHKISGRLRCKQSVRLHMEDSKNYNSKCSFRKKKTVSKITVLPSLIQPSFCLDMQIELKSWSNYSDNSKKKKPPHCKKKIPGAWTLRIVCPHWSSVQIPGTLSGEIEESHRIWARKKFHEHFFFSVPSTSMKCA